MRVPWLAGTYAYDGRAYLRQGPTTRIMPREEFERRLIEHLYATRRWENKTASNIFQLRILMRKRFVPLCPMQSINAGRMGKPRNTDIRSILVGLGLIIDGKLLNAAVMLFGKSKRLESLYPQCALMAARFRGQNRLADYADNRQFWGHAFGLLRKAESFLLDHMPIAGRIDPGKMERLDAPVYPPRAVREALANAFCHRDYAEHGGAVSIAMYDDRLEIINPGELHFGITPAKLSRPHESKPWNPIIANVFYRAGIIEKWGSGTLNIIDWCKGNSNPKPSWIEQSRSVVLKFLPNSNAVAIAQESSQQESQQESLRDRVLLLLASGPLSRSEIVVKLGQKQLSRHLYNVMHSLLEEGVIAYTVPDKPHSRLQKYVLVRNEE
jgi:ATP-dependent DNA helicase RecG